MDQGPCCSQRSTVWGIVCRAYNGDTSFSELDAGEVLLPQWQNTVASGVKLILYPYSSG